VVWWIFLAKRGDGTIESCLHTMRDVALVGAKIIEVRICCRSTSCRLAWWTLFALVTSFCKPVPHKSDKMAVELLSQADGYGIIVGLSVLFCGIILVAVRIQKRYLAEDSDQSEMFMVANRSVGTGLTCSAVFSSWM
jgi:uncharacterized membrane protein (DUF485 family)